MSDAPPSLPSSQPPQEEPSEALLARKFPNLKPKNPPLLGRINGCGFSMFGKRDTDIETGTYIKSYGITFLWIPLLTLSAYRVADADRGGWYFLGKEKLSSGSKILNLAVLALIVISILGIKDSVKKSSPEYRAQQTLNEAGELAANGRYNEAAEIYLRVAYNDTNLSLQAAKKIPETLLAGLKSENDSVKIDSLRILTKSHRSTYYDRKELPDPYEKGIKFAADYIAENPDLALETIEIVKPVAGVRTEHENIYISIYNQQIAAGGKQAIAARKNLALLAEASGNSEAVLQTLEPIADSLDSAELHRVYGQALADFGQYSEAIPHLETFTAGMVDDWKKAIVESDKLYQKAYEQEFEKLDSGAAPESFYTMYESADEDTQSQMVDNYLRQKIIANGNYIRAGRMMDKYANLTPSIMTLGIAYLRNGQQAESDEARDTSLAKAEESFLSLRDVASESTDYQFFLGQVYYWLNKPAEGKKLFDTIIANNPDDGGIYYTLAQTLREVGETEQALELAKLAHEKASDEETKNNAASLCATMSADTDEKIEWLEKTDLTVPSNKSSLLSARADQAYSEGDTKEAVKLYRQSLQAAPSDLNDAVILNNRALVHSTIYRLTGDMNDLNKSVEYLEKATALNPNNSILCANTASALYNAAIREVLLIKHSSKFVQLLGNDAYLRTLYDNEEGREQVIAKLNASSHFKKAVKLYEKATILAPQDLENYSMLFTTYSLVGDYDHLAKIVKQLERAQVDTTSNQEDWEQSMHKEDDKEALENLAKYAEFSARLREQLPEESKVYLDATILDNEINSFTTAVPENLTARRQALEKSLESNPCSQLRSTVTAALSLEAYLAAKEASPEFATWAEPAERSLGTIQLLLLGIHSTHEFSDLVRDLPEVQKFANYAMDYYDRFPKTRDLVEWAITMTFDPDSAPPIAEAINASNRVKSGTKFVQLVAPYSPSITINRFWKMKMAGQDEAAKEEYTKTAAASEFLPDF